MTRLARFRSFLAVGAFLALCASTVQAQDGTADNTQPVKLTVPSSTPLRVVLTKRVPAKQAGEQVEGRLVDPVYAFDRIVIPADTKVLGRVTRVDPAPRRKRAAAVMRGDFTPLRQAQVEFDTLMLEDGTRLALHTSTSLGTPEVVHLESSAVKQKKKSRVSQSVEQAQQQAKSTWHGAVQQIKTPGRMHRLKEAVKEAVLSRLPYHRQGLRAGTVFTAELQEPLEFGTENCPTKEFEGLGSPPPSGSVVHARLTTPLSSASAKKDEPIEAMISEPLFDPDHRLVLPQGSLLKGKVVQARPARRLHRNGQLRITFERIDFPSGISQRVDTSIQAVDVASADQIKLDSEGGASAKDSNMRYVTSGIAIALAASAASAQHEDETTSGKTEAEQAANGAIGFGLVGTVVTLASHSQAVTAAFGAYGAAQSVYSHFLMRGREVVFPMDTPMEIAFGTHDRSATKAAKTASTPQP